MRKLLDSKYIRLLFLLIWLFAWYNRTHNYKFSIGTNPVRNIHKKILTESHGNDLTSKLRKLSDFERAKFIEIINSIMPEDLKGEYECDTSSLYLGSVYLDPFTTEELFEHVLGQLQVLDDSGSITSLGYTYYYLAYTNYGPILLISFFNLGEQSNYILCRLKNISS
ncbi:MAG: hypothetical protein GXO35_05685 [Gammaproteobacteria bacterium]|nr:hypothetical protein [Gammaproteobacteria bacterium]